MWIALGVLLAAAGAGAGEQAQPAPGASASEGAWAVDRLMGAYEVLEHATEHEVAVWGYRVGGGGEIGDPVRVLPAKRARPWAGHVSEGILAMRAGRLADATSLLRAAVERFTPPATEQAVVWLTIGGMHASQAELDKAEAAFENSAAALAAMPGSGTDARSHLPQYALGTLAARRGRFSDAAAAHERALFFCPDFVPSLHALAALQLVRGDFDAAAHYLRIACSHVEAAMKVEGAAEGRCVAAEAPFSETPDAQGGGGGADGGGGGAVAPSHDSPASRRRLKRRRRRKPAPARGAAAGSGADAALNGPAAGHSRGPASPRQAGASSPRPRRPARHLGLVPREQRSAEESHALDSMPRVQSHALSALRAPPVLDPIPSPPPALAQGQAPLQDSLWRNATSFHDAAAAFLRALPVLSVSGDLWALHMNIGRALQEAGAFEEAMLHLRSAAQLAPPHEAEWLRLYTVLALPVVFDSAEDAAARKAALAGRVADELAEFAKSPDSAAGDPSLLRELYASTHMLPFIGLPHKRLASDIAAAFRRTRRHNLTSVSWRLPLRWPAPPGDSPAAVLGAPGPTVRPSPRPPQQRLARAHAAPPAGEPSAAAAAALRSAAAMAHGTVAGGATVRVGVLSYQVVDGPTGHLVRRLVHAMRTYSAAAEAAVARLGTGQAGAVPSGAGLAEGMQRFARVARPSEALQAATVWGGGSLGDSPPRLWGQGVMPRAEAGFERVCGQGHIDGAAPGAAQRNAPCTPVVPGVAAFEPVIVLARPTGDQVTKWCLSHAGGRTARLWVDPGSNSRDGWRTRNLTVAQRALADADLDVLVVLDNAIDPFVAALLQSRSAPVQIAVMGAGSGHLLSPGLADSVDYLVVGDAEAHDTAASGVAEQLVRLGGLGTFFAPMHPVTRGEMFNASARLALFASRNYYVVPRLLPAMHPDFDGALARILAADPDGVIFALFEPLQTLWLEQLRARLLRTLGKEALARVRFVPRMARRQLWAVLTAASVVLDTFPVGMGVLAMECAFVGAPVVALPELQPLRSPSAALMRRLHVAEWLVADSLDDFAAKAVQVATNRSLRGFLRAELLRRSRRLPWPFDPDLGLLSAPLAASSTAPEDQAVFEELLAEDSSTAHAASMALSDAEGTLGDWLQFLGRTGRDPARVRAGGGAADEVVLGPLGLGGGWL